VLDDVDFETVHMVV